ncbi:sigma-54 interaction domain-containing protein [Fundidesulfovibrio terrae]|uniref:sigma-54 interaction domain-containing protein n=1 Tax=Fundidesulfovibrio terrae TaxID=2922866 RepID=UPI001FB044C9|nr:sigma 54-interacting transcriptional regulator [Fundidesulfovibrio terrae]
MDISRHWQDICHAIQEGVFIVNPEGRLVMANDAMSRLTGYSVEELQGRPCTVLGCDTCALGRKGVQGAWCPLFAGRESAAKRCTVRCKDGSRLPVFKNQSLIRDKSGQVIGAVESILDLTELDRLDRKVEELSRLLDEPGSFHGMVGTSPAMARLRDILEKAARSEAPVLLLGESGTGKELAARAIHELGGRSAGPFVQLNCAALSESLLESELFGHARGAFTGAVRARRGRFEEAHGGDIFLDEIGDAPLSIQVKLLRVLETKSIERVGENRPVPVDARLIAATHQDLRALMAAGRFREDFFFRINVIPIELPPLRSRMEDLAPLAAHFLRAIAARSGADAASISPEAMRLFMEHRWPGNVRELRSALEYACVLAEGGRIEPWHLPPGIGSGRETAQAPSPLKPDREGRAEAGRERAELVEALRSSGGNKSQAARILGVSRLTVQNRMRKHGIDLERRVTDGA